jgi:AcrR family transcriptional regulator
VTTASELRDAALEEFASAGYLGTSIQAIAARAGVSKASVLYHYSSKETLLDAALSPAIDAIAALLPRTAQLSGTDADRHDFLVGFVDLLMQHRLAAQIFITQSGALVDVPVVPAPSRSSSRSRPPGRSRPSTIRCASPWPSAVPPTCSRRRAHTGSKPRPTMCSCATRSSASSTSCSLP